MKKSFHKFKIIIMILCLGFVVFFSLFDYNRKLNIEFDERTINSLKSRFESSATVIEDEINRQFDLLTAISSYIADYAGIITQANIQSLLNDYNDQNISSLINYVNINGLGKDNAGISVDVSNRDYFKDCLKYGRAIDFVENSLLDHEKKYVLAVSVIKDGEPIGVVIGVYDDSLFMSIMTSMAPYESNIYICDKAGKILSVEDNTANVIFTNIYEDINVFDKSVARDEIENEILSGIDNIIVVGTGSNRHYVSYFTIAGSDWTVFTTMPYANVWEQYNDLNVLSIELITRVSFSFLVFTIIIYFLEYKKRLEIESERELLRQSEERYRLLDELTDSLTFEVDFVKDTLTFSNNYKSVFGYEPDPNKLSRYLVENKFIYNEDLEMVNEFVNRIKNGAYTQNIECRIVNIDGDIFWCKITGIALKDSFGHVIGFIGKISNRDEQIKEIIYLKGEVGKDSLTKLNNRLTVESKVNSYLATKKNKGISAFFMIDLDDFKQINDLQGHLVGDQLLIVIAEIMNKMFRKTDIIGRMGGDEFAVFMVDVQSSKIIAEKAEELLVSIKEKTKQYCINNNLSCSIGIAIANEDNESFKDLYKRADVLLYQAKKTGKNQYKIDDGVKN